MQRQATIHGHAVVRRLENASEASELCVLCVLEPLERAQNSGDSHMGNSNGNSHGIFHEKSMGFAMLGGFSRNFPWDFHVKQDFGQPVTRPRIFTPGGCLATDRHVRYL